jgi:ubiquinol-cytochrome c reductase cytochrome b subunit
VNDSKRGLAAWINSRLGGAGLFGGFLNRAVPDETSLPQTLGSASLFLLVVQVVTGIVLAMNYSPAPEHAYDSITYIMSQVLFGPVLRGVHHWGSSALVVVVGLHMLRTFVWGSYKAPRELTWMAGVALLLIVMGFAFTGYLLPWTQRSYWATVVGTKIMGTVPGIGPWLLQLVRGEADVGPVTLARFYAIHVLLLPALLVPLVIFHLYLVYRHGIAPAPGNEATVRKSKRFYPEQLAEDLGVSLLALLVIFALVAWQGVPTEPRADPSSTTYVPRPEWYFLFYFQLLKYFEGPVAEPFGVVVLPLAAILLLFAIPLLDRRTERRPGKRPFAMAAAASAVLVVAGMTYFGAVQVPPGTRLAPAGSEQAVVDRGHDLFIANSCQGCHVVNGQGTPVGPELTHIGSSMSAEQMTKLIRNPGSVTPNTRMPAYDKLSDRDVNAIVVYMQTLRGTAATPSEAYNQFCAACHQAAGNGIPGAFPPLAASAVVAGDPHYLTRIVLYGISGHIMVGGQAYTSAMSGFDSSMSDAQIAQALSYIRGAWGNSAAPVGEDVVKAERAKPGTPQDNAAQYPK